MCPKVLFINFSSEVRKKSIKQICHKDKEIFMLWNSGRINPLSDKDEYPTTNEQSISATNEAGIDCSLVLAYVCGIQRVALTSTVISESPVLSVWKYRRCLEYLKS